MKKQRREFLKLSGIALAGLSNFEFNQNEPLKPNAENNIYKKDKTTLNDKSIIGQYGSWVNSHNTDKLPSLSFRKKEFTNIKTWQKIAKKNVYDRLSIFPVIDSPVAKIEEQFEYDGLHIEKLTWQLPYGRATEAYFLKPIDAKGKLPAVLAFHDHGGNKYFGTKKIIKTGDEQHPMIANHQKQYYEGKAWANELAKKGYCVLVSDAFAFGSRRVMFEDVPQQLRNDHKGQDTEKQENIDDYNDWANQHEQVMARSLFSAGTTWPAMFINEDKIALDILCNRSDVDSNNVGCCGLSGGGLRTVYLGGLDNRIKCAIPIGFMTTWTDFLLHKSFTHTWMTYVPLLPNELNFPEILGLRTPLPTLVLNDIEDNLFTLSEMQKADKILNEIYKKANAPNNYRCSFHPGSHKFDKKMQAEAFDWFDKWLK